MSKNLDSDFQVTSFKSPCDLHREFRIHAMRNGTTVQELLVEAMRKILEEASTSQEPVSA